MSGTDYLLTPKLGLYKPITDADVDQWGVHWNLNADRLDTSVQYDAKGNVGISVLPPANQAPSSANANGGWVFGWGLTANNWATNGYYDGTSWRYLNADALWQQQMTGQQIIWQFAPTGAKDAVASLTTRMTLDSVGNLTLPTGSLFSSGAVFTANVYPYVTFNNPTNAADHRRSQIFLGPSGELGMQFVNDASTVFGVFFQAYRTGGAISSVALTAPTINLNGEGRVSGNIFANGGIFPAASGTGNGFALYLAGDGSRQIRFTTDNWRLFWQNDGSLVYADPTLGNVWYVTAWGFAWSRNNASVLNGVQYRNMSSNAIGFGWASPNTDVYVDGNYQGHIAYKDQDNNFARVLCSDMMNYGGTFYVAGNYNYYLQRSVDGNWYFVENTVWSFRVGPTGDTEARAVSYAAHQFSRGNVYALNDWTMYFGGGGQGRILQFASNWYWDWNGNDGQCSWVAGGTRVWQMRQSPDNLVWNPSGTVGGYGAYTNFSDRRAKRDIEDATQGLAEILKLRPVSFKRLRFKGDARAPCAEIGFVAQDVRAVLPEAVVLFGSPLPDGTGGMDDDDPTLGLTIDPIVAALVNAVKEMHAEIQALKRGRHA